MSAARLALNCRQRKASGQFSPPLRTRISGTCKTYRASGLQCSVFTGWDTQSKIITSSFTAPLTNISNVRLKTPEKPSTCTSILMNSTLQTPQHCCKNL